MGSVTLMDLMLESSPHLQGIVTSECSAFDLLRLSTVTREARLVSLRQLGRRKIDLLINTPDEQVMSMTVTENGNRAETMTVTEKPPKPPDRSGRAYSLYYADMKRKKYAGVLIELARNSRIRRLEFKENEKNVQTISYEFGMNEDLDEASDDFHVDTIKLAEEHFNLLMYFTPRVLIMTWPGYTPKYYSYEGGAMDHFTHRGFLNCVELKVDDRHFVNAIFDGPATSAALQLASAASIDLSPSSRISYNNIYNFLRAYQIGRRDIRYLIGCVDLSKKIMDINSFSDHLLEILPIADDMPYPAEVQTNSKILEHFKNMAELHMHDKVTSRAVRVGGPHVGRHLVVVSRQFDCEEHCVLSLGIYEQDE